MRLNNTSYSDFMTIQPLLGAPYAVFYDATSGNVNNLVALFSGPVSGFTVNGSVTEATLLSDRPQARLVSAVPNVIS